LEGGGPQGRGLGFDTFEESDHARNGIIPTIYGVGAAFCRPQVGVVNKDNGSIQARAAGCRPYAPGCWHTSFVILVEGFATPT